MTVPLSDVTEAPDRIEQEIKDDIAMQAGLGALVFVVVSYRGHLYIYSGFQTSSNFQLIML